MQRWIPVLVVALCVQVAAAVLLGLRQDRLAPHAPDTPLVAADLGSVDRLTLDGPVSPDAAKPAATKVELVKRDGKWVLPGYFDAPADAGKVKDLLHNLATARRGLPIATSREALGRFKVAADNYERRIVASAGGKTVATVYVGSSPGLRKSDARTADDRAVYAVALATYDLPAAADKWLDAGVLDKEAKDVTQIALAAAGKPTLTLHRDGAQGKGAWTLPDVPPDKRLDHDRAAALANVVARVRIDAVLGTQANPEWRQDKPELELTLGGKDGKSVHWILSKPEKADYYVLKSSGEPWYFRVEAWNARPVLDAAAEDKLVVAATAPAGGSAGQSAAPVAHAAVGDRTKAN
jgi:hypothetical protein